MNSTGQGKRALKTANYLFKNFRFVDEEHRALVAEAAKMAGLSVNAWMVNVTLQVARKQLSQDSAS